jgi:transposase
MASAPCMSTTARAERQKRVAAAYAEGMSSRAVAGLTGLSLTHVKRIANLYGVSRPRGRPSSTREGRPA